MIIDYLKIKVKIIYYLVNIIDWIWINQVWGGIKIGPNIPSYWGMNNPRWLYALFI